MKILHFSKITEKVTVDLKWEEGCNWNGEDEEEKKRNEMLKIEKTLSCVDTLSSLSFSLSDEAEIRTEDNLITNYYSTCSSFIFDKEMKKVYCLLFIISICLFK